MPSVATLFHAPFQPISNPFHAPFQPYFNPFHAPEKIRKTDVFLIFSGGIEKDQWHEMG